VYKKRDIGVMIKDFAIGIFGGVCFVFTAFVIAELAAGGAGLTAIPYLAAGIIGCAVSVL